MSDKYTGGFLQRLIDIVVDAEARLSLLGQRGAIAAMPDESLTAACLERWQAPEPRDVAMRQPLPDDISFDRETEDYRPMYELEVDYGCERSEPE